MEWLISKSSFSLMNCCDGKSYFYFTGTWARCKAVCMISCGNPDHFTRKKRTGKIFQAVHRVPRESGNGFRDDHIDLALLAAADHTVEFL